MPLSLILFTIFLAAKPAEGQVHYWFFYSTILTSNSLEPVSNATKKGA
jgi:hypothetical protein